MNARMISVLEPFVFTVCSVKSGYCHNVFPDEAHMMGTSRYFDEATLVKIKELAHQITSNICAANDCSYEIIEHNTCAYPMINAPEPTRALERVLK
mmetsp:Transcript_3592/g.3548  ORF Transcript_3592/g.3548 Transcript_3592/m.3548 type:complete len:96 (+) Transcript_3592:724-1011(+)